MDEVTILRYSEASECEVLVNIRGQHHQQMVVVRGPFDSI
jgi:hypothetical protein